MAISILAITGGALVAAIFGAIFLVASLVAFVLKHATKNKMKTDTTKLVENSEQLSTPCRVQVFRDSSEMPKKEWQYAFSLNNGQKLLVNDGCTVEFSTSSKNNALVGYGRSDFGGIGKHPSLDSPFKFEAVEGGLIKIISKPTFDYSGGNGKWKSNFRYDK